MGDRHEKYTLFFLYEPLYMSLYVFRVMIIHGAIGRIASQN